MNKFIAENWNLIMDHNHNPLRNIPSLPVRHMIMQVLAWMWVIVFTIASIAGIVITVAIFETAKRQPKVFNLRGKGGEHE